MLVPFQITLEIPLLSFTHSARAQNVPFLNDSTRTMCPFSKCPPAPFPGCGKPYETSRYFSWMEKSLLPKVLSQLEPWPVLPEPLLISGARRILRQSATSLALLSDSMQVWRIPNNLTLKSIVLWHVAVVWAASWQKPTKWLCAQLKRISMGISPVWSESSLC